MNYPLGSVLIQKYVMHANCQATYHAYQLHILCEFFIENNSAYSFGGRKDPFGLSNFEHCNFTYKDQEYTLRKCFQAPACTDVEPT